MINTKYIFYIIIYSFLSRQQETTVRSMHRSPAEKGERQVGGGGWLLMAVKTDWLTYVRES